MCELLCLQGVGRYKLYVGGCQNLPPPPNFTTIFDFFLFLLGGYERPRHMYKGGLGGLGDVLGSGGCFGVFFMICDAFLDMYVYCGLYCHSSYTFFVKLNKLK